MKLVDELMQQGLELNITGNGGTHYNGVKISAVYDDFIVIEPTDHALRSGGQFRGGQTYVNIATITRLEQGGIEGNLQDSIRRKLR